MCVCVCDMCVTVCGHSSLPAVATDKDKVMPAQIVGCMKEYAFMTVNGKEKQIKPAN